MRTAWTSRALLLFGVSAVFVGLTLATGATASTAKHTAVLANSVTYEDSTGEDPKSLDIGTVTVSNDDTGLLTFDVRFVNGSLNAANDEFYVVMDTDRNEATGNPKSGGADYVIGWAGESALLKWNGTGYDFAPSMKTLVTMPQTNGIVVKIHPSELGNVTGFDFYVKTYRPDPNDPENEFSDWAPSYDKWSYDIKLYVPPVLSATAVTCTPDPPVAGKAMLAQTTVTVTRGTATERLGPKAVVKATATVGRVKLVGRVLPSYATGKVAVRWVIPKTAKGKMIRGAISVTLEKVTVTKTFTDRVK